MSEQAKLPPLLRYAGICTLLLSGCASADSTTQQLSAQTDRNQVILAGEQQKTGALLSERSELKQQLSVQIARRNRLASQEATPVNQEELRQVNEDIAKLRKAINSFQN